MWPFKYPYTNFHEINLDWILETVKSNTDRIAENELKIKLIGGDDPLNSLHPVGSIFISTENTSPASMFGGEWEQIGGKFLLGASDIYSVGSTGGEATHELNVNEMPSHRHTVAFDGGDNYTTTAWEIKGGGYYSPNNKTNAAETAPAGGSQPHNNMPPYLAVNMWRRVS